MNDVVFEIVQSFTSEGQSAEKETPHKTAAAGGPRKTEPP
jgi:hypothetical protein